MSYFLYATRARKRALEVANIPVETFTVRSRQGLLFDAANLPRVLEALGAVVQREEPSEYEGINILTVRPRTPTNAENSSPPPVTVQVGYWANRNGNSVDASPFLPVVREFAASFGAREVVLSSYIDDRQIVEPRREPGRFDILIWAAPAGGITRGDSASSLWGLPISREINRWNIWWPSGSGTTIFDSENNPVGELVDNNLYLFYPLSYRDFSSAVEVFRKTLEEAIFIKTATEEEKAARALERFRRNPVYVDKWNGSRDWKPEFVEVATELAAAFGNKQIVIHDHSEHPSDKAPIVDGRVHIYIYAAPAGARYAGEISQTLFGEGVTQQDRREMLAAPDVGEIIKDESDNRVGVVVGDSIYIYLSMTSAYQGLKWGGRNPAALFRKILEEVVFIKTATEEEKAARERQRMEMHRPASREAYIKACGGRMKKTIEGTKRAIEVSDALVLELQEKLVKSIREGNGARRKLEQLESANTGVDETYGVEFDKLLMVDKVRDVRIQNGLIKVFTDTLYCVDPRSKRKHKIGAFCIEIELNGKIHWRNLTGRINGRSAPHIVNPDDTACLGNLGEILPELIAKYEFAVVAMLAIQFVESVNTDDSAGKAITLWPVAA